jgi:hypothetical protein
MDVVVQETYRAQMSDAAKRSFRDMLEGLSLIEKPFVSPYTGVMSATCTWA